MKNTTKNNLRVAVLATALTFVPVAPTAMLRAETTEPVEVQQKADPLIIQKHIDDTKKQAEALERKKAEVIITNSFENASTEGLQHLARKIERTDKSLDKIVFSDDTRALVGYALLTGLGFGVGIGIGRRTKK